MAAARLGRSSAVSHAGPERQGGEDLDHVAPSRLPVFLQSADYLRAALSASPNVPDNEMDLRVKAAQELHELLSGRGLQCTFYLHEQALQLPVGGHEVHVGQVHHLLLMAIRTNISIRILPTALGAHASMTEVFTHLTFPTHEPLVVLEHENSTLIEETKVTIERYQEVVSSLDAASLDEEQSQKWLLRLGEQLSAADVSGHVGLLPGELTVSASLLRADRF